MDITFLLSSISRSAGGISSALSQLTQYLNNHIDISVVALQDEYSKSDLHIWDEQIDMTLSQVNGPKGFGFSSGLTQKIKNYKPDILHTHGLWMYPSVVSSRWVKKNRGSLIISPHGMLDAWALANSSLKKKIAGLLFEKNHLKNADCLHALNHSEYESIREYGLKNPVAVIPNGIELPEQKEPGKAPWNDIIPSSKKVLLYLGRMHPKKGLDELLFGCANFLNTKDDEVKNYHLVIAGWDQAGYEKKLQDISNSLNIQNHVTFIGPLYGDNKDSAFRNASGFILPSKSEGFPMTILEAWSYRLPVLMTPECNIPEGFKKDAALRIEPKGESIASGLKTIFEMNGSKRQKIGENGFKLVKEEFTWTKIGKDMISVYNWILKKSDKPACVRIG